MRTLRHAALTSFILAQVLGFGGAALAHSPYLLPNVTDTTGRDHVTVEASFTEDLFAAEVVMRSDAWHIVGPNGDMPISQVTYLTDMAVFEAPTPVDGTYRISSGARTGRTAKMYRAADAYVTRGLPSDEVLQPTGHGLEMLPLIQPGDIVAGEAAPFRLLLDGQPLAGVSVTVFREAGRYDGRKVEAELVTDAEGRIAVTATDPRAYMTLIRHRMAAPTGSAVPYRSYSHSLVFVAQGG